MIIAYLNFSTINFNQRRAQKYCLKGGCQSFGMKKVEDFAQFLILEGYWHLPILIYRGSNFVYQHWEFCLIPVDPWQNSRSDWHPPGKHQGSKGIRQWPINWFTSLIMIHKISVDYNYWLKHLDTQFKNQPIDIQ